MLILFDRSTPNKIRRFLPEHQVEITQTRGWNQISNGSLLHVAEAAGFEMMISADQNIVYQQNLTKRRISLVVLGSNRWSIVRQYIAEIKAQVALAEPNSYAFIEMPVPPKVKRV